MFGCERMCLLHMFSPSGWISFSTSLLVYFYSLRSVCKTSIFALTPTLSAGRLAWASDNVNEDKPVPFVVKQPGSFNLKMHLGRGGGWRLKPSPSYGASQRVRRMRHRDGRWAGGGKVGAVAGLDWLDNLCTFFLFF